MKNKRFLPFCFLTLALCTLSFFIGFHMNPPDEEYVVSEIEKGSSIYTVTGNGDYSVYQNLEEMANLPEYIVLGRFVPGSLERWNMNRDLENPELENEDLYMEGELRDFQILHVLKGKIPDEQIKVNFPHEYEVKGEISNAVVNQRGEIVKEATEVDPYSFQIQYEHYVSPRLSHTAMLFLQYNELFDLYFPSGAPYLIEIADDGQVELRSNLIVPTDEERERMVQEKLANKPSDVHYANIYEHWSDREIIPFYSEGGQEMHFIRTGPLVEDFLGDMHITELLEGMNIPEEEQIQILEDLAVGDSLSF